MTNGGRHTALRARMARSNPPTAQYPRDPMGGGAASGTANSPPGRSARCTPANSASRSAGRKCPSAPKLTARSNAAANGRSRASARTHAVAGPGPRPRARVRLAGLGQHARAEVDPGDRPLAHRRQDRPARAGAAAHVQSRAERAEPAQGPGGGAEDGVVGAERGVVELRGQPVVAALDRGQRLRRQLTQRRAPGREHRPRLPGAGGRAGIQAEHRKVCIFCGGSGRFCTQIPAGQPQPREFGC